MTFLFDLHDRVAIVTGSTKGIGLAIAKEMAKAGARVVVSSRSYDDCMRVQEDFIEAGYRAYPCKCDVTERLEIKELVKEAKRVFGRIDIVVANAGGNPYAGLITDIEDSLLEELFNVNLKSALWLAAETKDHLTVTQGSFIYIGSISGVVPNTRIGAYGIIKAAGHHLIKNLASEWGHRNIRVNAILPGVIRTEFSSRWLEDKERVTRIVNRTLLGRIGEPDEVAGAAVFLASQAASFITGQIIIIDGGLTKNI